MKLFIAIYPPALLNKLRPKANSGNARFPPVFSLALFRLFFLTFGLGHGTAIVSCNDEP